jgi:aspartate/methionine/tyrosine aminotransferase
MILYLSRKNNTLMAKFQYLLMQKYHILLVPGSGFGAPGFFRIAYCVEDAMIERSLPHWEKLALELGLAAN